MASVVSVPSVPVSIVFGVLADDGVLTVVDVPSVVDFPSVDDILAFVDVPTVTTSLLLAAPLFLSLAALLLAEYLVSDVELENLSDIGLSKDD